MALTVVTIRPNATVQTGVGTNTVSGAANAHTAWNDNTDASYVQLTARARNASQVVAVTFPTPTIPAEAKVLSVGVRWKPLTVAAGSNQPIGFHFLKTLEGSVIVSGQALKPYRELTTTPIPTSAAGGTYVEQSLGVHTTSPSGAAWDPTTNLLTGNFAYELGRGDDFGGNMRVSEVYVDVTYQQQSTVTATAPTGTISTTQPTGTWTWSSPDSQPQQGWEGALYTAAQVAAPGFTPFVSTPLQSSGLQLGEDLQWTFPEAIPDGSYSFYVRAYAKWSGPGDFPTAISSTTFTRTVSGGGGLQPPNTTLSSVTFDSANDRNAITMVPSSSTPVTVAYDILVSRDGGVTFTLPPSFTRVAANGMTPVTVYDYLAPISATSHYKVLGYSKPASVYIAAAGMSSTLSVLTSGTTWRLADPANSLNNCIVIPVEGGAEGKHNKVSYPRLSATFQTLGGSGEQPPIVVSGPTYGESGTLTLIFVDDQLDNWAAFKQQLQSGHTLLLKKAHAEQLWVRLAAGPDTQDPELTYGVVPGRPDRVYWRKITLGYTQCRAPSYF